MTTGGLMFEEEARTIVEAVAGMASRLATDDEGMIGVAACFRLAGHFTGRPTAEVTMPDAPMINWSLARNMSLTALWIGADTRTTIEWDTSEVAAATNAFGRFCSRDGGILVFNSDGGLFGALAVCGRTPTGDRILAAKAVHSLGYLTNFDEEGRRLSADLQASTTAARVELAGHSWQETAGLRLPLGFGQ